MSFTRWLSEFLERLLYFVLQPILIPVAKAFELAFHGAFQNLSEPLSNLMDTKHTVDGDHTDIARMLVLSKHTIVLTGAGVSQESGVPTFRDPDDGIWDKHDSKECATIWGFDRAPQKLWQLLRNYFDACDPQPNAAHRALAELEAMGLIQLLVTQNVDGLHQTAGSKRVVEYHGNLSKSRCRGCGKHGPDCKTLLMKTREDALPPRCSHCGDGVLKPNATLFGEALPGGAIKEAATNAEKATLIIVIGTSARVKPASHLPKIVSQKDGAVIELNRERTGLTNHVTDVFVEGKAGEILPLVVEEVKRLRSKAL
eukprot:comp22653_c0_seq1/m.34926 comp22653_c0_seq1/g.34926  ORF comp22653_c0_seq1/g.34926 comp22653_c0_seq1/m.34926 type:complete len:313 (-) comp22653_c0_seq1:338-1276(-)